MSLQKIHSVSADCLCVRQLEPERWFTIGPRLQLLQTAAPLDALSLSGRDIEHLTQLGFLDAALDPSEAPHCEVEDSASVIRKALDAAAIPAVNRRPVVVMTHTHEPLDVTAYTAETLEHADVLWTGETELGLHIGPYFRTLEDAKRYETATMGWSQFTRLRELGFRAVPTSLSREIRRDSARLVAALAEMLRAAPADRCWVVAEQRYGILWTALHNGAQVPPAQMESLCWPKGVAKNLRYEPFDDVPSAFVAWCWTPSGGDNFYESNSGKGFAKDSALLSARGEALERFAAWNANALPSAPREQIAACARILSIEDFHPMGSRWTAHNTSEDRVVARSLLTDARIAVPAALVPFPLNRPGTENVSATTIGLAVAADAEQAVAAAAMEIIEANDLYTNFLPLKSGQRLIVRRDDTIAAGRFGEACDALAQVTCDVIFFRYTSSEMLPVVHALLLDNRHGVAARGSGSGASLGAALERALLEALQLRKQQRILQMSVPNSRHYEGVAETYRRWRTAEVIEELREYVHSLSAVEIGREQVQQEVDVRAAIAAWARQGGTDFLTVNLPCAVETWCAVRVLAPHVAIHPYASNTKAGRTVADIQFLHGVVT